MCTHLNYKLRPTDFAKTTQLNFLQLEVFDFLPRGKPCFWNFNVELSWKPYSLEESNPTWSVLYIIKINSKNLFWAAISDSVTILVYFRHCCLGSGLVLITRDENLEIPFSLQRKLAVKRSRTEVPKIQFKKWKIHERRTVHQSIFDVTCKL